MTTRICLAGAIGWAGSALTRGIAATTDLELVAAVPRASAGRALGEVPGEPRLNCPIFHHTSGALPFAPPAGTASSL